MLARIGDRENNTCGSLIYYHVGFRLGVLSRLNSRTFTELLQRFLP